MSYRIFTSADDVRVIAINEDGDGFMFTPEDDFKREISPDWLVYDDMGELWVSEELFGAEFNHDVRDTVWRIVNDYFQSRTGGDDYLSN